MKMTSTLRICCTRVTREASTYPGDMGPFSTVLPISPANMSLAASLLRGVGGRDGTIHDAGVNDADNNLACCVPQTAFKLRGFFHLLYFSNGVAAEVLSHVATYAKSRVQNPVLLPSGRRRRANT